MFLYCAVGPYVWHLLHWIFTGLHTRPGTLLGIKSVLILFQTGYLCSSSKSAAWLTGLSDSGRSAVGSLPIEQGKAASGTVKVACVRRCKCLHLAFVHLVCALTKCTWVSFGLHSSEELSGLALSFSVLREIHLGSQVPTSRTPVISDLCQRFKHCKLSLILQCFNNFANQHLCSEFAVS